MEKNKLLYVISCLLLGLLFLETPTQLVSANVIKKSESTDTEVTAMQYKNNILKTDKVDVSDFYKLITKKGNHPFYLFFGSKQCQYCRSFSVTLKKFMSRKKTLPVYYVDVNKFGLSANAHSTVSKKVRA